MDALEIIERRKHLEYYGRDARRFTTDLLKGKRARLEIQTSPTSRDQYGRLLAFVFRQSDNVLVNNEMMRQGMSRPTRSTPSNRPGWRSSERRSGRRVRRVRIDGDYGDPECNRRHRRPCCRRFPRWVM